jgi:cytochrome c oxidase assembly protein subunit 11
MQDNDNGDVSRQKRRQTRLAFVLGGVALFMGGLAFAAVPLYSLICTAAGIGGATQRVSSASDRVVDQVMTVHFDANISPKLKWRFSPVLPEVSLKIGENKLIFYTISSREKRRVTGTATFNVTPEIVGKYFDKIECFCFTEQTLKPGESAELPVSFFIDPAILDDPDARDIREITLSYTFFPSAKAVSRPVKSTAVATPPQEAAGGG